MHCHPRDTCEARTDACAVKSTAPGKRGLPPKAGVAWWMIEQSRAPSGAGISLLSQHLCTAPTPAARLQWRLHISAADYGSGHAQNIQCGACWHWCQVFHPCQCIPKQDTTTSCQHLPITYQYLQCCTRHLLAQQLPPLLPAQRLLSEVYDSQHCRSPMFPQKGQAQPSRDVLHSYSHGLNLALHYTPLPALCH